MRVIEVEADLCDACGVRAYVYAELPNGSTLAYCGHHGARFMAGLLNANANIIDMRHAQ